MASSLLTRQLAVSLQQNLRLAVPGKENKNEMEDCDSDTRQY